jgi:hypothetical protein
MEDCAENWNSHCQYVTTFCLLWDFRSHRRFDNKPYHIALSAGAVQWPPLIMTRLSPAAIVATLASILLFPNGAAAERVGYRFTGQMTPPLALPGFTPPDTYTLFKVKVPTNAPIAGTFSYDTTAVGKAGSDDSQVFVQSIQGGETFDVFGSNGALLLHVAASKYTISVNNDFLPKDTPSPIDSLKVDLIPPPPPIIANGANITTASSTLTIPFNWDPQTFTGPDQPYLWANLPAISYTTIGLVGTSSLGAFNINTITPISPTAGDYNIDGRIDANDYAEWRNAFGSADALHSYADGNHDGVVDAQDYIVWRDALSSGGASGASIPEPSGALLVMIASLAISSFLRTRT